MSVGLDRNDRAKAAFAATLLHILLAYILIAGLWVRPPVARSEVLALFDVLPDHTPPPPEKVVPAPARSEEPEGAASPPNIKSVATEIVAPPPRVVMPVRPPVVTAPQPGRGIDPSTGAADFPGPGTGAGGEGDGTGSGRGGFGRGGGLRDTPPIRIKGRLKDSDFPREAWEPGIGGTVSVIFAVQTDGRVTDCRIIHSSGSMVLDETTRRLIERRYRFQPALDEDGRPVRSRVTENHSWIIEQMPPEP